MSILKLRGMLPALLAAAGLAAAMPGTAQAQGGVSLVPWAGAYIPTRNSFEDLDNAAFDRDISVMGGARLTSGAPASSASRPPAGIPRREWR